VEHAAGSEIYKGRTMNHADRERARIRKAQALWVKLARTNAALIGWEAGALDRLSKALEAINAATKPTLRRSSHRVDATGLIQLDEPKGKGR